MAKKRTIVNTNDILNTAIEAFGITPFKREYDCSISFEKDFSVLQDFTDEELAAELCRRTSLGKELE